MNPSEMDKLLEEKITKSDFLLELPRSKEERHTKNYIEKNYEMEISNTAFICYFVIHLVLMWFFFFL